MPACDGSRSRISARSAEDHGLDPVTRNHRVDHRQDGGPRRRQELSFQELAQILVVKECLFLLGGQGNGKSAVGEDVG